MTRLVLLAVSAILFATSAFAVDGQVLINQSTVIAAGGFPYRITQPGSYKLTGNLTMTTTVNGNQLDASFRIPSASLNSLNVAAPGLDPPHPLDLLEDDGITDIHGSITSYSYTGSASVVPGPASLAMLSGGLAVLLAAKRSISKRRGIHE